ncbi:UNVERIFIED_CONTAM: hypothetical protein RMT77_013503 [Armadillidium vulgare]
MSLFEIIKSLIDDRKIWEVMWSKKGTDPWKIEDVSPFLIEYSSKLKLSPPKRVFVPLCGKALELKWFYDQGFEVVGVEYIEKPVKKFFTEQNLDFKVNQQPFGKVYETIDQRLKIYVADIFKIDKDELGKFDILWVSGVFSSIKIADREKLTNLFKDVCNPEFTFFLCVIEFEVPSGKRLDTFPRSIKKEQIYELYGDWCKIELVEETEVGEKFPMFKQGGIDSVLRYCFLLTPK